ncbi:MarR family transcriptional regulator [Demequina capsici]|uniref:MarR family transcriptional regulator n=1 Tax=Demequina capsici TaxID=3075620 RepID=A0AA96FDH0_9MICO|nr:MULTISPECIES: MarR family transcriptional regulator [unclassified Demequina]WNM25215.1 MarR family transcriptional regulator [Demequina sp. OYTSA14]WNM28128.1 MarR family transcriptional regulator [Demequina sp. PMTSA13]
MTAEQLDSREDALWQDVLALSMLLPAAIDEELHREAGLSLFEFSVLAMLSRRSDRTETMSRLAQATYSSASRMSHAASRLEERGLLERTACPTDRRSIFAHLTDAGLEKVQCSVPVHTAGIRRLVLDGLGDEDREHLARILEILLRNGGIAGDTCRA